LNLGQYFIAPTIIGKADADRSPSRTRPSREFFEMSSFLTFHQLAAARGDGLLPEFVQLYRDKLIIQGAEPVAINSGRHGANGTAIAGSIHPSRRRRTMSHFIKGSLAALVATALLGARDASAQSFQTMWQEGVTEAQSSDLAPTPAAPGTKVLAVGTLKAIKPGEAKTYALKDMSAILALYLTGKADQFWLREDGKGVVLLMTVGSIHEADKLLQALPLSRADRLTFELMPVGPLSPLGDYIPVEASTSR
jgi:hypothetical protein